MADNNAVMVLSIKNQNLKIKGYDAYFRVFINKPIQPGRYFLHPLLVPDMDGLRGESLAFRKQAWEGLWWKLLVGDHPAKPYPPPRTARQQERDGNYVPHPHRPTVNAHFEFMMAGIDHVAPNGKRFDVTVHSQEFVKKLLIGLSNGPLKITPGEEIDAHTIRATEAGPIVVYQFPMKSLSVI